MKSEGYLKEIEDADWVQEIIMERFDNALELMTPNSIIYGGAVRDCLAKKELVGDLDFAIPYGDFNKISEAFQTNPKWIPAEPGEELRKVKQSVGGLPTFQIKSSGDMAKMLAPMSAVSSFITMGGKIVQLIASKYQDRDALQSSIYVARMVDIICCGVIMLHDGRIFEAIPGAYQDCLDGVLRINRSSDTIYLDALDFRVQKLVDRGWKNLINVNKVKKEIEENREKEKRRAKRLAELRQHKKGMPSIPGVKEYNFTHHKQNRDHICGGYMQEIPRPDIDRIFGGDVIRCIKTLDLFANKEGINIRVKHAPIGSVFFETINNTDSYRIMRRIQLYDEKQSGKSSGKSFHIESWPEPSALKIEEPIMEEPGIITGQPHIGPGGGGGSVESGSWGTVSNIAATSSSSYTSPTAGYYTMSYSTGTGSHS